MLTIGPCWVLTSAPHVVIVLEFMAWLSMLCVSTAWIPCLMTLMSSPATPPFAPQSTKAPDLMAACLETLQMTL